MEQVRSLNLFIASAGLGSRLRPVTDVFPKPLLPLAGLPLIERLLYSVQASLTIQNVAMNLHYKPELFEEWAKGLPLDFPPPKFYYEAQLLGTGGAIANARDFFMQRTCLLVNGDILAEIDWNVLMEHHYSSGNMVTLAVQDRSHERRVGVDAQGNLLCIDNEMKTPGVHRWMGYACAAVYEPEFLDFLPDGESHVPPFWVKVAEKTGRVGTVDIGACPWIDLGNVDSYTEGVVSCLNGSDRFFAEPLKVPWDTRISGICLIEKDVQIGSGVELEDVILLPGARIEDGEKLASVVAGPGFRAGGTPAVRIAGVPPASEQILSGSDRIYSRVADGMLLEYTASEVLIDRQIALTGLLRRNDCPVPRIISHNPAKRQLLLQDLGDESLRPWCKNRPQEEITSMLKTVLDRLIDFQWTDMGDSPVPQDKPFDQTVLLWESSYFIERCVYRMFGLHEFCRANEDALNLEFDQLADIVAGLSRHLMHRDFQSSNVMMVQGEPWFIDFQAAHHGPCFYDAASLIGDPYLNLPRPLRKELEEHYLANVAGRLDMTPDAMKQALVLCGLQRHMQALGAYGFISAIRGKNEFLKYIPPALNFLGEEVFSVKNQFPALNELVDKLVSLDRITGSLG